VLEKVDEAPLREGDGGLAPDGDGWFIVNVADAAGMSTDGLGHAAMFEGTSRFPEFGINVHVLRPGEPASMYHREGAQEAFLVLSGECTAIVEDEERPMRRGDLLMTPPGTAHVLVGAGEGPCAVLMVGSRKPDKDLLYPVSEVAGRYGASVQEEATEASVAYAGVKPERRPLGRVPW
jgi:uncharacterized cupin superfamily protein